MATGRRLVRKTFIFLGVIAGCLAGAPVYAVPDASPPGLLGGTVGAEAGFSGSRLGSGNIPYYLYGWGGVAHTLAVKGELLGGGGYRDLRTLGIQLSVLPLPLVSVAAEPGITQIGGSTGPSIGLRATGSLPIRLHVTGYGRVHFVNSRAVTEVGAGVDYPLGSLVRLSLSAIHFDGNGEPAGTLYLVGLKLHLGI